MWVNFYWLYEVPSYVSAIIITSAFVLFGLAGLFPTRGLVRRLHRVEHSHNDIVGFYLAAVTVLYGITLGLVAVGTWTTHSEVENRVSQEAEIIGSLYHDIQAYPEPQQTVLEQDLRDYAYHVINVVWPQQQAGIISNSSDEIIRRFQKDFMAFEPTTPRQQIIHAEIYKQFNQLIEMRRARISSVRAALPLSLWVVVIIGALITIASTWFFDTASISMHIWMTTVLSGLLGLMIYVVVSLDNPFRGHEGIKPEPLEMIYAEIAQSPK